MTRLENWKLIAQTDMMGTPCQKLVGVIYGHPMADTTTGELCDGHTVVTSKVVDIDWVNGVAVTQSGTVYELGKKYTDAK